jgi:hypothetical protein
LKPRSNRPTRSQVQRAKNELVEKFWANAWMGDGSTEKTISATRLQVARREAWVHGMYEGVKAGLRLARVASKERK